MIDPHGAKCADLRKLLQEIDENFEIAFDYDKAQYLVYHNESLFQRVPYGEFTRTTFADIRHTVWLNKTGQIIDYVEKSGDKVAAAEERAQSLYAESLAKDLRRPLIENYFYGK